MADQHVDATRAVDGGASGRRSLSRRQLLVAGGGLGTAAVIGGCEGWAHTTGGRTSDRRAPAGAAGAAAAVGTGGHPLAWFFRQTEATGDFATYGEWEAQFRHLGGIHGKMFLEELADLPDAQTRDWFTTFKRRHPDKLVLLHFNGKARRPQFHREAFFAGHWLYYAGTTLTADIKPRDTLLKVAHSSVFKTERPGRPHVPSPDDLVIVPRRGDGSLDWNGAEHARLARRGIVDATTIKVVRGQYGTSANAIDEGAYVAAHVRVKPPALPDTESLWCYNLSATGPREPGTDRRCIDVLADEIASWFAQQRDPDDGLAGSLRRFDGLEFDVLYFVPGVAEGFAPTQHLIDVDNNGRPDGRPAEAGGDGQPAPGFVGGVNVYGQGVTEFCGLLRGDPRMSGKLVMADGMLPRVGQRSFTALSGMESEGFPVHGDPDFADWSGGLNRLEFWKRRGAGPKLNYQVFKYHGDNNLPGRDPDAYKRLRLALAAAAFTDSAFAQGAGWAPPAVPLNGNPAVKVQVFDELWRGTDQQPGWLGPASADTPAVHLAERAPDLLAGGGLPQRLLHGEVASDSAADAGTAPGTGVPLREFPRARVTLKGEGPEDLQDLFVVLRMTGAPLAGYPDNARRISMRLFRPGGDTPLQEILSWCDRQPHTSTFAFRDLEPGAYELGLQVEGAEPVRILRLTAHQHQDVMYREFPGGVVLANPSHRPYTFDLATLLPDNHYRRIAGHHLQDGGPDGTNNGEPVCAPVEVEPLDALLLARTSKPCRP